MNEDSPFSVIGRWLRARGAALAPSDSIAPDQGPAPFAPMSIGDYIGHAQAQPQATTTPAYNTGADDLDPAMHGASGRFTPESDAATKALGLAALQGAVPELALPIGAYDVFRGAEEMGRTGGKEGKLRTALGGVNAMLGGPAAVGRGRQVAAALEAQGNSGHALIPFGEGQAIKAYHGSPHDFEKFDAAKIGTGEGAQAYGHGLYFAEHPGTAAQYRQSLGGVEIDGKPVSSFTNGTGPLPERGSLEELAQHIDSYGMNTRAALVGRRDDLVKLYDELKANGRLTDTGKTYEVAIKAHPDEFLSWDAPLSEQSPQVQDAINKLLPPDHFVRTAQRLGGGTGEHGRAIYNAIAEAHPRRTDIPAMAALDEQANAANAKLAGAGIKGIKYLDAGSRAGGEGTSNYVVFDHDLVEILKKYGLAGLLGSGAAASQQDDGR